MVIDEHYNKDALSQRIRVEKLERLVSELYDGLDSLYITELTERQTDIIKRLQNKILVVLEKEEVKL